MKKQLLTALTLCALALAPAANAQVICGYNMTVTTGGTMQNIGPDAPGVTIVQSSAEEKFEAEEYAYFYDSTIKGYTESVNGFEIGFDFKYGNKTMKYFGVCAGGYIALRETESFAFDSSNTNYTLNEYEEYYNDLIGLPLGYCEITPDTYITYKVDGTRPSRKLYIQIHGLDVSTSAWGPSNLTTCDIQFCLSENDGSIEIMMNGFGKFPSGNCTATRFGLRTGYKEGIAVMQPEDGDHENDWTYAEKKVVLAKDFPTCKFGSSCTFPDGLTFTFTRPSELNAPNAPATDLVLASTPTYVSYDFTPSADAQTYLVVYTEGNYIPNFPTHGTLYKEGDELGYGKVAYFGPYPESAYDRYIRDLNGSTKYNVYVYACNSYGSNGPQYNETALNGSIYTTPADAESVTVTSTTLNSITGTCVSNENNNDVLVIYSTTLVNNIPYASHGDYGTPKGTEYNVGDIVEDGHDGKVAYVGKAGEFTINDLPETTPVFIAVYAFDENGTYSEGFAEYYASTSCTLPYEPTPEKWIPYLDIPAGWTGQEFTYSNWKRVQDETTGENTQVYDYVTAQRTLNGNESAPTEAWLELPQIDVTQRFATFTLQQALYVQGTYWAGGNKPYTFGENDYAALQISEDHETWTDLVRMDKTNQPEAPTPGEGETINYPYDVFNEMTGVLDDYVGKTVYLRYFIHNEQNVALKACLKDFKVAGDEIPEVPQVTVGEVTYNSAALTWRCDDTRFIKYEYGLIPNPCLDPTKAISGYTTDRAVLFEGLEPNTEYLFSVRGIISEDPLDASEWGGEMFTTKDWPEVEAPVPSSEVAVTENSATVSWSENEDYLSFEIKYRAGSSTEWLSVTGIKENSYTFTGLEANTVYLWAVKAACTHSRETVWSNQAEFTTAEAGIDNINANNFSVSCNDGVLNIVNKGVEIRAINLFDTTGRNIATYDVNSADNVMIPLNVVNGIYIVNIQNADGTAASYRVVR